MTLHFVKHTYYEQTKRFVLFFVGSCVFLHDVFKIAENELYKVLNVGRKKRTRNTCWHS